MLKLHKLLFRPMSPLRALSTSHHNKPRGDTVVFRDPIRQVFISQSNDVFTNLALEDWIYRNHDFDHKVR